MFTIDQIIMAIFASVIICAGVLEILQGIEDAQKTRIDKAKKYAQRMYNKTSFVSYKITA